MIWRHGLDDRKRPRLAALEDAKGPQPAFAVFRVTQ